MKKKNIFLILLPVLLLSSCNKTLIDNTKKNDDAIEDNSSNDKEDKIDDNKDSNDNKKEDDSEDTILDYSSITKEEFYSDYKRATSYLDANSRSKYYLMSGDISSQVQEPTVASNRPILENKYIHNSILNYSDDFNSYTVSDYLGNDCFTVYKGGAYVTLEEVAAYVYAFLDVPANYYANKKTSPNSVEWGEYTRVNNSEFYGDTLKYPYEPELPKIKGCGGDIIYYEIDIGTLGTDCDSDRYPPKIYNDGTSITRGAARIVYTKSYLDGSDVSYNDRYVFYTYNHYNDFQEYLNYYNGWGDKFGNISAGNSLSDKTPTNPPTSYIESIRESLV